MFLCGWQINGCVRKCLCIFVVADRWVCLEVIICVCVCLADVLGVKKRLLCFALGG